MEVTKADMPHWVVAVPSSACNAPELMRLLMSSGVLEGVLGDGSDVVEDLTGDVALEASDGFSFGESFSCAALEIVGCGFEVPRV